MLLSVTKYKFNEKNRVYIEKNELYLKHVSTFYVHVALIVIVINYQVDFNMEVLF